MCLELRKAHDKPHNGSKIRYKVVKIRDGRILSMHENTRWRKRVWMRARNLRCSKPHDVGFHVLITLEDAKRYIEDEKWTTHGRAIIQIEVKDFVASGNFRAAGPVFDNETWKHARLLKVVKKY